jgi:polyisoprenoid-binding protein YceI
MKWNIDVTHSQAEFAIKHMMISTVRGRFKTLTGFGESDAAGTLTTVSLDIDVASIDTNQQQRDDHLRSADFFDVANNPLATFRSTAISQSGDDITITGHLTMKGVTKPVTLTGEYASPVKDPWGNQRAAVNVSATINRKDWGLEWNTALETGGFLLSNDVKLAFEVQAVAEAAAA